MSLLSSGLKNKPNKLGCALQALLATCFHAGFLLVLFFDPEDGGGMFLQNVS
jgi:hypothetical protein